MFCCCLKFQKESFPERPHQGTSFGEAECVELCATRLEGRIRADGGQFASLRQQQRSHQLPIESKSPFINGFTVIISSNGYHNNTGWGSSITSDGGPERAGDIHEQCEGSHIRSIYASCSIDAAGFVSFSAILPHRQSGGLIDLTVLHAHSWTRSGRRRAVRETQNPLEWVDT